MTYLSASATPAERNRGVRKNNI